MRVELNYDGIAELMRSTPVRASLRQQADRILTRANQIAQVEGIKYDARVVEGTRPKGRPYARVESNDVAAEWGDSKTVRRRVLGRAAEIRE